MALPNDPISPTATNKPARPAKLRLRARPLVDTRRDTTIRSDSNSPSRIRRY